MKAKREYEDIDVGQTINMEMIDYVCKGKSLNMEITDDLKVRVYFGERALNKTKRQSSLKAKYLRACEVLTEFHLKAKKWDLSKRGFDNMQVDHIVPKGFGYKYGIPVELISSSENLQYISKEENMEKGGKIIKKARALLVKWGYDYLFAYRDVQKLFI